MKKFFKELRKEFKKIIWPSRNSLAKQTGTVIFVSLLVSVIVAVYDLVFSSGVHLLNNFIK